MGLFLSFVRTLGVSLEWRQVCQKNLLSYIKGVKDPLEAQEGS